MAEATRIVILGGGFGGVYTASALEKLLRGRRRGHFEITLVSKENYITFQPLLPEVISGSVDLLHVISPIRRLAKRTKLCTRKVEAIDLGQKTVRLAPGHRPRPLAIPFRYLGDALRLRNHVVRQLEEASLEADPDVRRRPLTFVAAGGGFSGVERMAELQAFSRRREDVPRHRSRGGLTDPPSARRPRPSGGASSTFRSSRASTGRSA